MQQEAKLMLLRRSKDKVVKISLNNDGRIFARIVVVRVMKSEVDCKYIGVEGLSQMGGETTEDALNFMKKKNFDLFDIYKLPFVYLGNAVSYLQDKGWELRFSVFFEETVSSIASKYTGRDKIGEAYGNNAIFELDDVQQLKTLLYGDGNVSNKTVGFMVNYVRNYDYGLTLHFTEQDHLNMNTSIRRKALDANKDTKSVSHTTGRTEELTLGSVPISNDVTADKTLHVSKKTQKADEPAVLSPAETVFPSDGEYSEGDSVRKDQYEKIDGDIDLDDSEEDDDDEYSDDEDDFYFVEATEENIKKYVEDTSMSDFIDDSDDITDSGSIHTYVPPVCSQNTAKAVPDPKIPVTPQPKYYIPPLHQKKTTTVSSTAASSGGKELRSHISHPVGKEILSGKPTQSGSKISEKVIDGMTLSDLCHNPFLMRDNFPKNGWGSFFNFVPEEDYLKRQLDQKNSTGQVSK